MKVSVVLNTLITYRSRETLFKKVLRDYNYCFRERETKRLLSNSNSINIKVQIAFFILTV